ncbi:MAG: hypothetical protein J6Y08_08885 [Clostridiales bacterium]|nr:hypothetical protein [Clostridiales bacterium]
MTNNTMTKANRTEKVLTGKMVTTIVGYVGMVASALLFGWGFYHHNGTQMAIFGIMALFCGATAIANSKK